MGKIKILFILWALVGCVSGECLLSGASYYQDVIGSGSFTAINFENMADYVYANLSNVDTDGTDYKFADYWLLVDTSADPSFRVSIYDDRSIFVKSDLGSIPDVVFAPEISDFNSLGQNLRINFLDEDGDPYVWTSDSKLTFICSDFVKDDFVLMNKSSYLFGVVGTPSARLTLGDNVFTRELNFDGLSGREFTFYVPANFTNQAKFNYYLSDYTGLYSKTGRLSLRKMIDGEEEVVYSKKWIDGNPPYIEDIYLTKGVEYRPVVYTNTLSRSYDWFIVVNDSSQWVLTREITPETDPSKFDKVSYWGVSWNFTAQRIYLTYNATAVSSASALIKLEDGSTVYSSSLYTDSGIFSYTPTLNDTHYLVSGSLVFDSGEVIPFSENVYFYDDGDRVNAPPYSSLFGWDMEDILNAGLVFAVLIIASLCSFNNWSFGGIMIFFVVLVAYMWSWTTLTPVIVGSLGVIVLLGRILASRTGEG